MNTTRSRLVLAACVLAGGVTPLAATAQDDPVRDIEFPVFVTDYLTDAQARQMAYQPDMILEFAHYLQTDLRNQGIPDAAVRAEAYVSLNGRPSQLLIDPTVDLTKETNSIWPKPWILPLADDPPRHQLASFN